MIPKRPRPAVALTRRALRVVRAPLNPADVRVLVAVAAVPSQRSWLPRALASVATQDCPAVGVAVLWDGPDDPPEAAFPDRLAAWVLSARCGSAARARNALLDFAGTLPGVAWVARLDADDALATPESLRAAVELGDARDADVVVGGNRLFDPDGVLLGENAARADLSSVGAVLEITAAMAEGRGANELPSCNLVLRNPTSLRYPDIASAEDHWLVAEQLVWRADRVAVLHSPLFADYTLGGPVTQAARAAHAHLAARRRLHEAVATWAQVAEGDPGPILGLGQEGIVRARDGFVRKTYYPGALSDVGVAWLEEAIGRGHGVLPRARFERDGHGRWTAIYRDEGTSPATDIPVDAARDFLVRCLRARLVCPNVKRSNFRLTASGSLVYSDLGPEIRTFHVSWVLDAAARLYGICAHRWSDGELARRRTTAGDPLPRDLVPGFPEFYREVLSQWAEENWAAAGPAPEQAPGRRAREVTLLIKACAMDARDLYDQVVHLVDQLTGPALFFERVLLLDPFDGPFLRQHAPGDVSLARAAAARCLAEGWVDRVIESPADPPAVAAVHDRWFGLPCPATHSASGVPVAPQLWGFEQVGTRYVLQCDVDVLVGRRDPCHDFLADMVAACAPEDVIGVAFNIPHAWPGPPNPYDAPPGAFVPEVRCGLLNLERMRALRPLPNAVADERLTTTWYRSVERAQRERGKRTLRGGDPATFYVHPPNAFKADGAWLAAVRDQIGQGRVPAAQIGRWDLIGDADFSPPVRQEQIVVVARGRDTPPERLSRFARSLRAQDLQEFGVVVLDDASAGSPRRVLEPLRWLGDRLTLVRNAQRRGPMANLLRGALDLCGPGVFVVVVDLDDALLDRAALRRMAQRAVEGHDVVLGAMFRPDEPTREYHPDFEAPRERYGGDVWIHHRGFARDLLAAVPLDLMKDGEDWYSQCTDYATMIPMVELARSPVYVPEYLYWHERWTRHDAAGSAERDATIMRILARRLPPELLAAAARRRGRT